AVRDALKNGKRVLWICNTVAKAQAVFDELRKESNAATYHSRFKYRDRVDRHGDVIDAFEDENNGIGFCAVTTQVAEMSLDLNADLLISEVAPMSALIQRLGRLNRRITTENPGSPRMCLFLTPEKTKPYDELELQLAEEWIKRLTSKNGALTQADLAVCFNALSPQEELKLNLQCNWLDSGWFAEPEHIRDTGISVSVLMAEDMEACRANSAEIIKRAIPMNYNARRMNGWREYKGHLIAPNDAIEYDAKTGAKLR
ncbi:MAG: CRISPR-associated helicase Cas3', partial [Acidobacteriota bacterium]|nr:CRISPR-associated helicase Cas3' [Acidobacteriota bacterium]